MGSPRTHGLALLSLRLCVPLGTKELFLSVLQGKQWGSCHLKVGHVALMDFSPCPAQLLGKREDAQPSPFLPGIKQSYSILHESG